MAARRSSVAAAWPEPAVWALSILSGVAGEGEVMEKTLPSSHSAALQSCGRAGNRGPPARYSVEVFGRKKEAPSAQELIDQQAADAAARQAVQDQRLKMRQALDTGDEKFLPLRDKGPQKRFARDYVDARFSIGEYLMFGALVFVIISLLVPASSDQM